MSALTPGQATGSKCPGCGAGMVVVALVGRGLGLKQELLEYIYDTRCESCGHIGREYVKAHEEVKA